MGILLLLSFGPWAFNRLTSFVKSQIEAALSKPVAVHYHQLDSRDSDKEDVPSTNAERAAAGLQFSTLAANAGSPWFLRPWRQ
jgi:vomeronasal1 receptor